MSFTRRGNGAGQRPDPYEAARKRMVDEQLRGRVRDERVLEAMGRVPRHRFVAEAQRARAYEDTPLPIGLGQTISQPLMVAILLEELELHGHERVLEVGAGCGYQAALLGALAREVLTVEVIPELYELARINLELCGARNVQVVLGDGSLGYAPRAPYDAIVVAAAAPEVPPPLVEQLATGGRLLVPVGSLAGQTLVRVRKRADGTVAQESLGGCAFVPLVGRHGR